MFCKDILADVNEGKVVPDSYLQCTISKNLQIPETFAESSHTRTFAIVYNFCRFREPILISDQL